MKKQTMQLLAALLLALPHALCAAEALPPFSWDRVPVYAHVGKTAGDFTPAQLDFLAQHFNFVAFEKGQAFRQRGDSAAGIAEAAAAREAEAGRRSRIDICRSRFGLPSKRGRQA